MTKNSLDNEPAKTFSARTKKLDNILAKLETDWPQGNNHLQRWRQTLTTLADLRTSFSLPVTCIGPVKSGKSTLINTLAGADLLPTGAGITTSFPTTVSTGKNFSAHIELQPETTINEMFAQAVNLLFSDDLGERQLSLFKAGDRLQIDALLNNYQHRSTLTRHGIFNESYRLLRNLINGAEKVAEHYLNQQLDFIINNPDDHRYRLFIRDETLSPYLLGIQIKAALKLLPPYLALRDLPGLDTPNPSHQSVIVQQLGESPALIYVISSRIGLRQADYQLLEHLRELGLEERLLFVINLDLDEHPNKKELGTIIDRCTEELRELGFTQPLYAFSALALFWSRPEIFAQLNKACQQRFARWQEEGEKLATSTKGAEDFLNRLIDLGENEATTALLQHSEKRLQQIVGSTQRLIANQLTRLSTEDDTLSSDQTCQHANRHKIDAILKETERIITGICTDIEKYSYIRITNWLNDKGGNSLHRYLSRIIDSYHPPLELLPEKSRNPLTPVRIIDNHFQITIPPQLRERVVIETVKFLASLHQEINERLLNGCAPLFILCDNLIGKESATQEELPLPVKIDGEMPEFTMISQAEERFAIIDKIHDLAVLWSKKITRLKNRRPLGEEYGQQLKKATLKELPRWLGNFREQLKYAFLRHHIEECRELTSTFFIDLLTSTEMALEHSEQLAGDDRLTTAIKTEELKRIETLLDELRD
ncbi:MAG: dynamin family protein [Deltaproteobacteria bacterium]|nr:dynamin family protein [Candidatus Tharpella sp.]